MNSDTSVLPFCFSRTITHPVFAGALERLLQLIRTPTSTRIVIVTGPPGAGKSTLMRSLEGELLSLFANETQKDPESIPFGRYSVKAPSSGPYSWKDNYLQLLRSLQHPFADSPRLAQGKAEDTGRPVLRAISPEQAHKFTNDRLFRIVQNTIGHRRPSAILMDEAHHLLRLSSEQSLVYQLDHLKYIADETGVLHVLFGTYELVQLMDLSGALIRRREVVHFPRYVLNPQQPQASLEGFASAVNSYAEVLNSYCDFDLLDDVPLLYRGSVGCVGILRDWLVRAHRASLSNPSRKITTQVLESTMMATRDRLALLNESLEGEGYFSKRSLSEADYMRKLGFSEEDGAAPPVPAKPPKPKRRPGVRKPHNDPVGLDHLIPSAQPAAA